MPAVSPLLPGTPQADNPFVSAGGVTVAYAEDWVKHHVIENDGLTPLIYQYLHKNTKGREHALSSIRLPETVVFELNFPRAWYTYDTENMGIAKRPSKMLDAGTMYEHFAKSSKGCDIVAQFFHVSISVAEAWKSTGLRKERHKMQTITYVEFFTAETLHTFLFQQGHKPDGVLQKFVLPKSEGNCYRNSQMQVSWSPLMTTVYKRTNRHRLDDHTASMLTRAATYDGPDYFSDESLVADETKSRATRLCEDIAEHFFCTERKQMTRLNLFFKTDDDNRMWLLWCSSIRVAADSLNPSLLRVPPLFNMRTEVVTEGATSVAMRETRCNRQKHLLTLDYELFNVTHDTGFALSVNASHRRQAASLDLPGMGVVDLDERSSDPRYNPHHPLHESFVKVCDRTEKETGPKMLDPPVLSAQGSSPLTSRVTTDCGDGVFTSQQLVSRELTALAMDAWYAVYSTTLSGEPTVMPTSMLTLGEPLTTVLKPEELSRLLEVLGLLPVSQAHAKRASESGLELPDQNNPGATSSLYVVPSNIVASGRRLDRPSTQVESDVVHFFQDIFKTRGEELTNMCLEKFESYFDL